MAVEEIRALLWAALLAGPAVHAENYKEAPGSRPPVLAAIFGDHAVLQRGQPIAIWGKAPAGSVVTVQLNGESVLATADGGGKWRARLPAMAAGGPYALSVGANGGTSTVNDIMIGDVFLCGGQSNMELPMAQATNAAMDVAFSASPLIRFVNIPRDSSAVRLDDFKTVPQWQVAGAQTTGQASAVCYHMARALQRRYEVPVGFVNASWGGSTIQSWISGASMRKMAGYAQALDVVDQYAADAAAGMRAEEVRQQAWWETADPQARAQRAWAGKAFDDSAWPVMQPAGRWNESGIGALSTHRGVAWFRTTVELTAQQAAAVTHLLLGQVATADTTWVNGVRVGANTNWWTGREYAVPRGVLTPGRNVVAVRVLGDDQGGGLVSPAGQRALRTADGARIALPLRWKYQVGSQLSATQPPTPWEAPTSLGTLYNGMIAPLQGYAFKLAAWYQGEANAGAAREYRTLLPLLFDDWRQTFAQPDLPFLVAQLTSFGAVSTTPGRSAWAELRQAQSAAVRNDPHAGLAVTFDFGDRSDIHPSQKAIVGQRLARAARAVAYGEKITPGGPEAVSASRSGEDVVIRFANTNGGLRTYSSDTAIGFEVCEQDACRYARATAEGDTVRLPGAATVRASKVRYGWSDAPFINLFSMDDLPASGFELDLN
ncbi:sialate O-acetylesterase [Massilia sp. Root351]|uniref:sialate O-acetylesterase n=1 Tax=Massilia sp. Root351 TaxID=1736522 RepID=UPI0019110620|nr:sialate O-acetylesterase [Massilia sp. Root351]